MVDLIAKILINAAALFVAVKLLPSNLLSFDWGSDWWKLLAVALVFALVNSYIKPIVKALSFPIWLITLGTIAFVINAVDAPGHRLHLGPAEARLHGRRASRRTSPRTRSSGRSLGR